MPLVHLRPETSVLLVVDIQPTFMKAVHESDRVVRRSQFLIRIANTLGVPVLGTEQYPSRMGPMDPAITAHLDPGSIQGKMTFSCCECDGLMSALPEGRPQVVIVGAETHICVCLTALDLLSETYDVVVCPDAVSARSLEMHKLGMERIRDSGGVASHTETVAYEWLHSAEHPRFKEALQIVKEAA